MEDKDARQKNLENDLELIRINHKKHLNQIDNAISNELLKYYKKYDAL